MDYYASNPRTYQMQVRFLKNKRPRACSRALPLYHSVTTVCLRVVYIYMYSCRIYIGTFSRCTCRMYTCTLMHMQCGKRRLVWRQARYDLEYAHACVCSPEALCLFTDEFDWQDLHNDFVPGVPYLLFLFWYFRSKMTNKLAS